MNESLSGKDLHLRRTDKKGNTWVTRHRVWDAQRFLDSESSAASKEGGSIAVITEQQFNQERKKP